MKHRTQLALLATLASVPVCAQEVSAYSTTIAQTWRQDTPGLGKSTFTPATEFLGVDATKLGSDALSFHLYGWGRTDLADQSTIGGKNTGDLTYGYVQYHFDQANAEVKAGRFTVNQGVGNEQVDGIAARTDLRYGFTVSAFGGKPVVYKNLSSNTQYNSSFQQDVMYGGRLGWRAAKFGEVGVSYLQDGSQPAYAIYPAQPVDYTRRQLAMDLRVIPCSYLDISGRTVMDVNDRPQPVPGTDPSRLAEHDYKATAKVSEKLSLTGIFIERNFAAYFAGSSLPSLFNQNEQGMFRATGANATWQALENLQVVGDVRRTSRATYGDSTRAGAEVRWHFPDQHVLAGGGYHKVNAYSVAVLDPTVPSYSLSHSELRAWVMADRGALSASLDAILLHYTDASANPNLYGQSSESALVGSVGYQAKAGLKVSGDLTLEDTPLYKKQTMGLVRVEYRFGYAAKGGK